MAPPRKPIDFELVKKLAAIDCTYAEISSVVDVPIRTLERRCKAIIADGREAGKATLRRKQFELASNGNVAMLIWLGKQRLGQADKQESQLEHRGEQIIRVVREPRPMPGPDRIIDLIATRHGSS